MDADCPLTFVFDPFAIVVVAFLLADVFARLVHGVRGSTSTADPFQGWKHQEGKLRLLCTSGG